VQQLQNEMSDIDEKLQRLARYSLQSGVGAIGYRSQSHADAAHTEWVEIVFPKATTVDEVVLVPAIRRDIDLGFTSDAFPIEFRILASPNADENSADQIEIASFSAKDGLLPRIAPLVIPCDGCEAHRIRIEAHVLGARKFDETTLRFIRPSAVHPTLLLGHPRGTNAFSLMGLSPTRCIQPAVKEA